MVQGERYLEDCRRYRLHGTNRASFQAGDVKLYTWCRSGSSTALGELGAAFLAAQFELLEQVTSIRRKLLFSYFEFLAPLEKRGAVRLMHIPEGAEPNGHIMYLRFQSETLRERVQRYLLDRKIPCSTHYVPLHVSPMGKRLGYKENDVSQSLECSRTLLRLPIHSRMTPEQAEYVAEQVIRGVDHGL